MRARITSYNVCYTKLLRITGKEAQYKLDEVYITVNKNGIPYDKLSPFVTSGIRVGTPAVTSRGMTESALVEIAELLSMPISDYDEKQEEIKERVKLLTSRFPLS